MKNGKDQAGWQRYKCKDGWTTKILGYKYKYSEEKKEEIQIAYQERSSNRGVCRTFGIAKQTLSNWIKKKQSHYQIT